MKVDGRKGFTLIELIMVITILGVLASIGVPKYVSLKTDADNAACEANAGAINSACLVQYASQLAGASPVTTWMAGIDGSISSAGAWTDTGTVDIVVGWFADATIPRCPAGGALTVADGRVTACSSCTWD